MYYNLIERWDSKYTFYYLSAYGDDIKSVCRFQGSGENSSDTRCRDFIIFIYFIFFLFNLYWTLTI